MAALDDDYDQTAEPSAGFDTMPEHECVAQVIESDKKTTTAGTGKYIALTWEIIEGPYKGRRIWTNFNIKNPSEKAQQIGNAEFAAVRLAMFGSKDKVIKDTNELHNLPCRLKIGCRKRKDTGAMENHVKKFSPLSGATTSEVPKKENRPF